MEAKLQNFVKWMNDNGFNLNPKLELKRMPDERGHSAVAIEKIKVFIYNNLVILLVRYVKFVKSNLDPIAN